MIRVITSDLCDYLADESKLTGGYAVEAAFPESPDEVIEYMRLCSTKGRKVTVSGARTGIVGGAVPMGGAILSTERLNIFKGLHYETTSNRWLITVGPGVSLANLQKFVQEKITPEGTGVKGITDYQKDHRRFFFPVDVTESSASIGGMVATNASGARSFGYGATRFHVNGLQIVLADGEVLKIKRRQYCYKSIENINLQLESGKLLSIRVPQYRIPQVKHTAGFFNCPDLDPIDLFIGSEGLLGVIVEIELTLTMEPDYWFGGLSFFPSEKEALHFLQLIREQPTGVNCRCEPAALEFFDFAALQLINLSGWRKEAQLPEIPGYAQAAIFFEQGCCKEELEALYNAWDKILADCGSSMDDVWSGLDPKDNLKLKSMRHYVPEAINRIVSENRRRCPAVHKVGTDLAVPDRYFEELFGLYRSRLAEERIPAVIFGHIGDNNLHVNMLPTDNQGLQIAKSLHLEWARWAVEHGGTVVAEHGIGKLKGDLLRVLYPEAELTEMLAVKQALDPGNILGPGNSINGGCK